MQTCRSFLVVLVLLFALAGASTAQDSFPSVSPNQVGVDEKAIDLLDEHVARLVENGEMVGAEIHIIKSRKTILHKAYGWADREEKRKLETNSIYCVRSMTKPLAGTAIQMLLDEGKIRLDQPVAEILPAFAQGEHSKITIRHLLHHRSGLPFTIFDGPLSDYDSILKVAEKAAKTKLDFEPGSSFQYSDAGTDTLGAIVQKVSGKPLGGFIGERILAPMQMEESHRLVKEVKDRSRVPSAYSGGVGNWEKHWDSSGEPILPLFLASQGLFCTTTDYAKFLTLWMDGGKVNGKELLSLDAKKRAFAPGSTLEGYSAGFSKLRLTYGQQWMLYHAAGSKSPVIFGHNGSDGTYAWAWPEKDLIVLLFTQSRGSTVGIELESTLQQLLLDQSVEAYEQDRAAREKAEKELSKYVGIYWDEDIESSYYVVSLEDNQLFFERPGKFRAVGKAQAEAGLFVVGGSLKFQFDPEQTPPAVMLMTTSERTERQLRYVPDETLPDIEEVMQLVRDTYHFEKMRDAGVIKLTGKMKSGPLGLSSNITQWLDGRRSEFQVKSWTSNASVVTNGAEAAATDARGKFTKMMGAARLQEIAAHPSIQYGNWTDFYDKVWVMRQVQREGHELYVVRAEVAGLPGKTILVDVDSGYIVAEQSLQFIPGAGYLGAITVYNDFRETEGFVLPFHVETRLANPLIGTVVIALESIELGVDATGRFKMPEE